MDETMGAIIARKRKELGMTQEALAGAMGVSYQAVSKWENDLSSPDIASLPLLADTLGLTIGALFGRESEALVPAAPPTGGVALPWPDDDTLYAVVFEGHRLVGHGNTKEHDLVKKRLALYVGGDCGDVRSDYAVEVEGDVSGDVYAGEGVSCVDVGGSVNADGGVDCGDVGGSVTAGGGVDCGEVKGNVSAGGGVDCGNVRGSVTAGGDVDCGSVGCSVQAGGNVDCNNVGSYVSAGGDVKCDKVGGEVRAMGDVACDGASCGERGFDFKF